MYIIIYNLQTPNDAVKQRGVFVLYLVGLINKQLLSCGEPGGHLCKQILHYLCVKRKRFISLSKGVFVLGGKVRNFNRLYPFKIASLITPH